MENAYLYIRAFGLKDQEYKNEYPYDIPAVSSLERQVHFSAPVTVLVGENGSGKSTIVEALAVARGFNPEGGSINFNFATAESHSDLHDNLIVSKGLKRPKDGYFLRAESYFNVATNINQLDEPPGGGKIINSYGGVSLHEQSHGESFMALIENRLGGNGLYIFDEPEAALSPTRQLELIKHIKRLVRSGSQIIMATHSPLLMAYPGADILLLDSSGINRVAIEKTPHHCLYKRFFEDPEIFIQSLDD